MKPNRLLMVLSMVLTALSSFSLITQKVNTQGVTLDWISNRAAGATGLVITDEAGFIYVCSSAYFMKHDLEVNAI